MAKEKRPPPSSKPAGESSAGNDWDDPYGPQVPDAPAGESLPPRAARLASQNGTAMRHAFAYLLDEDPAPPPPAPPSQASKKRR